MSEMPPAAEDIVLMRDPDERPPAASTEPTVVAAPRRRPWMAVLGLIIVAAGGVGFWQASRPPPAPPPSASPLPGDAALLPGTPSPATTPFADVPDAESADATSTDVAASTPAVTAPLAAPLPELAASDDKALAVLSDAGAGSALIALLTDEALLTRLVVTIDNLPARKFGLRQRVLRKVEGSFLTEGSGDTLAISPANAARYAPLVDAITALPVAAMAASYRRLYPLLQEAYVGLGYADRQFHARVLEVIDHLLAANTPAQPVRLVQPKVFYRYADVALEGASVGHRALYRLDPAQMARIQIWLRALRAALVQPAG